MQFSNVGSPGSLVAATLQTGFPKLRFPAELEARYLASNEQERLRSLQYGFLGSIPLYLLTLVADHEMVPDCMSLAWGLRFWFYVPVVLLLCLALKKISSPVQREWLCAALGFVSCLCSVLISLNSTSALSTWQLATLAPILVYIVLLGRFWPMLAMCTAVLGMYLAVTLYTGRLTSAIGVGNGLLIEATMFNMLYGRYLLERSARHSFLTDLQEAEMDKEIHATTDQLARIAREDALTGLANRRHFTAQLQEIFLVARWGGEEFAIILADTSHASANALAQTIVSEMGVANEPHAASPVASHVTLSIGGTVCHPGAHSTPAECLAAADACLYQSKKSGRNRASIREMSEAIDASTASPLMT